MPIPENEPGSSIMPGKVNPTQCEALTMVAVQVFGNDAAVAFAGSQGNFQLNVFKPVMLHNVLRVDPAAGRRVPRVRRALRRGIEPNRAAHRENLDNSLMLVTALNPHIGYEKAAQIAQAAHREGTSLREAALKLGFVTAEQFDEWVRPEDMTRPAARVRLDGWQGCARPWTAPDHRRHTAGLWATRRPGTVHWVLSGLRRCRARPRGRGTAQAPG